MQSTCLNRDVHRRLGRNPLEAVFMLEAEALCDGVTLWYPRHVSGCHA
jgi:hypothetical protein